MNAPPAFPGSAPATTPPSLGEERERVSRQCTRCGTCVRECGFLAKWGSPGAVADACCPGRPRSLRMAFECSLCGLCSALCPEGAEPSALFLQMRREAVSRGIGDLPGHVPLRAYERRGTSPAFTLHALPDRCDTVFFPGCALAGTRPDLVETLVDRLEQIVPRMGVVLDCCTKPSHDLGRQEDFETLFGALRAHLTEQGVRTVLVACPSCYQMFDRHAAALAVRTVYEVLATEGAPAENAQDCTVAVHDPCTIRSQGRVHDAVRGLLAQLGTAIEELPYRRNRTLCCGEGGAVAFTARDLALSWARRSAAAVRGRRMVTYCAGCTTYIGRHTATSHVLDLLFAAPRSLSSRLRPTRPPWTYGNRLRLKRRLGRRFAGARLAQRPLPSQGVPSGSAAAVARELFDWARWGLWRLGRAFGGARTPSARPES